jgi:signal transduction histidine kinase
VEGFTAALRSQEPWSDLPVVLATAAGRAADARQWAAGAFGRVGAVTVLERPIRLPMLLSAVTVAVRVRERQYEMRDLLEELRVTVERLDAERVVRERFVSLLAHDLRGPLSAARLGARLLSVRPEGLDARRDVAIRIERNVERADRMIRDLLDANRLRAGHRLPLDLQL